MPSSEMIMYPVVDALGFPLTYDKNTSKVLGKTLVEYNAFGMAMDLKVTYSYLNHASIRFGVVLHMAGDLYILVCQSQGVVGLAVIDGSDLKEPPTRSSRGFRSPVMKSLKVWAKIESGVVSTFIQNNKGWSNVESLTDFQNQFFGRRLIV